MELSSSDWQSGKAFYQQLFDWQVLDQQITADSYYTMLKKGTDDLAAMYQMTKEQKSSGMQSHWLSYVAVENTDESVQKAQQLGADVMIEPHDIPALAEWRCCKSLVAPFLRYGNL